MTTQPLQDTKVEEYIQVTGLEKDLQSECRYSYFPETFDMNVYAQKEMYTCMQTVSSTQHKEEVECLLDIQWNAKL